MPMYTENPEQPVAVQSVVFQPLQGRASRAYALPVVVHVEIGLLEELVNAALAGQHGHDGWDFDDDVGRLYVYTTGAEKREAIAQAITNRLFGVGVVPQLLVVTTPGGRKQTVRSILSVKPATVAWICAVLQALVEHADVQQVALTSEGTVFVRTKRGTRSTQLESIADSIVPLI